MTPLCLINTWGPCPPDGFRYVFPEDGYLCHAWTYPDWVQLARNHYTANKEEPPVDLELKMQEQLCLTLPPGWCSYDPQQRPPVSVQLEWPDVLRGTEAFGQLLLAHRLVPKEEAIRRALICTRCYLNVNVGGCSVCQAIVAKVAAKFPQIPHSEALKNCAVCKCNLRAKVHFPMEVLDKENPGVQSLYPEHCWLKRGGNNFYG